METKMLYVELIHVGIGGVYATAHIPADNPIGRAIGLIASGEKTVITRLECSIVIAAGCVLTVHRADGYGQFVVTEVAHPAFHQMPMAAGRERCAQLLKIHGVFPSEG